MTQSDFEVYFDEEGKEIKKEEINKIDKINNEIVNEIEINPLVEKKEIIENKPKIEEKVKIRSKGIRERNDGWNQGDGHSRADQLVIYDSSKIPQKIKNKISLHKINHFKFIKKEDENEFIRILQGRDNITVIYEPTGKKDITIKTNDGKLIGNVHLLHVDRPDISNPEKYYVKFYLFNFEDGSLLRKIKDRIKLFFQQLEKSGNKGLIKVNKINYTKKRYPFKRHPFKRYPFKRQERPERRWNKTKKESRLNMWNRTKRQNDNRINKLKKKKNKNNTKRKIKELNRKLKQIRI